jgi:hypothetical protein
MKTSSSRGSCGKAPTVDGEADWRRNCCFLPPWHERPKCMCRCPYIIDVWKFDGTTRVGRHYFKCADTDLDFYGMVITYMFCLNFIHLCIFANVYVKFICFSRTLFVNGLT